jgi:ABC-type amino acid transport substrate-binding protein
MSNRQRVIVCVLLLTLAAGVMVYRADTLFQPVPPPLPTGQLRVAVDASVPPFATADAEGDLSGLDIDIGRALADELGVPVVFQNMGVDALYDSVVNGDSDVIISTLQPENWRTGDVFYTQPYFDAGLVLVTPVESVITTMRDLSGHALAYEFGSAADGEARGWLRRIKPFEQRPYEIPRYALDAARLREADAALVGVVSALLYLRDYPSWDASIHQVTHRPFVIAVHTGQLGTFRAVDEALGKLLTDGTISAIIEDWF